MALKAEQAYLKAIKELGFENYRHSEMSNSDNHLCTIQAIKIYSNAKLDEASYIVYAEVSDREKEEQILSLKDEV